MPITKIKTKSSSSRGSRPAKRVTRASHRSRKEPTEANGVVFPPLPTELHLEILNQLRDSVRDLMEVSLACKVFSDHARRILFSLPKNELALSSASPAFARQYQLRVILLTHGNTLAPYVQDVVLHRPDPDSRHYLLTLARGLSGVKKVRLCNINWSSIHPSVIFDLLDVLTQKHISLSLDYVTFKTGRDLVRLWSAIPKLGSCTFKDVDFSDTTKEEAWSQLTERCGTDPQFLSAMDALYIQEIGFMSSAKLAGKLVSHLGSKLRHLMIGYVVIDGDTRFLDENLPFSLDKNDRLRTLHLRCHYAPNRPIILDRLRNLLNTITSRDIYQLRLTFVTWWIGDYSPFHGFDWALIEQMVLDNIYLASSVCVVLELDSCGKLEDKEKDSLVENIRRSSPALAGVGRLGVSLINFSYRCQNVLNN